MHGLLDQNASTCHVNTIDADVLQSLSDRVHSADPLATVGATRIGERLTRVDAEQLMRMWGIGHDTARMTLQTTTQFATRSATQPLLQVYTDTVFFHHKGYGHNGQVFVSEDGMICFFPMKAKTSQEIAAALELYIQDIGVPCEIHCDNAPEMTRNDSAFQQATRYWCIKVTTTEPHSPWQNAVEAHTGEMRRQYRHIVHQCQCSLRLWEYDMRWLCQIMSPRTY
eukprot:Nitzschia sp. Nitz4//scaffold67_size101165//3712//4437//NITZ4_004520-RA/size101165-snap-gene-0.8-mRNA-1//-1//CDS//3329556447//4018//frame0